MYGVIGDDSLLFAV